MPRHSQPAPSTPPTTRDIAARASLSNATVSLALRHHPRISEATREKVARIAKELGYRPDPQVAKLMTHLRQRRAPRFQSVIVALTTIPEGEERAYNHEMRKGAETRAHELGYKLEVIRISPSAHRNRALNRMLLSRGIEGVLLFPMRDALPLTDMLDWNQFSVVAVTRGVPDPVFHRVIPNHFANSVLVCDQLERLGYRRIGLATNRGFDLLTTPGLAAGVVWQPVQGRAEQVTPLLYDTERPRGVAEWFARERPDAIVLRGVLDAEAVVEDLKLKVPGPVGLAVTNLEGKTPFSGIDGRVFEIGSAAIDQLNARIHANEKGVPRVPTDTTITGLWVAGRSVRSAHPLAVARRT